MMSLMRKSVARGDAHFRFIIIFMLIIDVAVATIYRKNVAAWSPIL